MKTINGSDQALIDEFNAALDGCQMSARGFFFALIPLFHAASVRGFLDMDTQDLSAYFKVSVHHTRRYLHELRKHQVIRVAPSGVIVCPLIIRQWGRP